MNNTAKKYIVVHSGSRDDYQVALALSDAGFLGFLVTDDYIIRHIIKREKRLSLDKIKTSYNALFWLILFKLFKSQRFQIRKDLSLSKFAAVIANRYHFDLLAYSYYALPAFQIVKPELRRILFQLHPQPNFVRKIFEEETRILPISSKSLGQEYELKNSLSHFENLNKEAFVSDFVVCASSFTKHTLESEGVSHNIHVIPYGIDANIYSSFSRDFPAAGDGVEVLFVGSLNQRKGIYYLLEAINMLQAENFQFRLTICGRGIFDRELLDLFNIQNLSVYENVPSHVLLKLYQDCDVFVLPSLCEGFAQVILEAMAAGLPVITTENTCALDVIENGIDGFVIPIRSTEEIKNKLLYLYENPRRRWEMGKLAHFKARSFSWKKFRSKLVDVLNEYS